MAPRRRSALGVNPNSAGAAATVPRCARSRHTGRHHDGVKRRHGGTAQSVGHPPLSRRRAWADSLPENRLHGVVAGKLYTYASDARIRRWPNGIEITGKRNTGMTNTSVSAALGLIGYAKRIDDPVSSTTAARRSRPPMRSRPSTRPSPPHRSGPSGRFVASTRRCGADARLGAHRQRRAGSAEIRWHPTRLACLVRCATTGTGSPRHPPRTSWTHWHARGPNTGGGPRVIRPGTTGTRPQSGRRHACRARRHDRLHPDRCGPRRPDHRGRRYRRWRERVTQYIVRSLAPDAYQTLMRDIDAAIDADLVEATVAAWCAVEG